MAAKQAMLLGWVSAIILCASADQLTVSGTVTDSTTGNPIPNAVVTLRMGSGIGGGGGGRTYRDTTDENGTYSITISDNSDTSGRISATASGYVQNMLGQTIRITNPSDGTDDILTVNIKLRSISLNQPTDTTNITIIALVVDSSNNNAPLAGVTVIITARSAAATRTATATTDEDGRILLVEPWGRGLFGATATATKIGYTSRTVTAQLRNDTINFGTIRLTALAMGDTITYRFNGRVTDGTSGLGNAIVSVIMTSGGNEVYSGLDTTSSTGERMGSFSLQTRQPYAENQSVTITVSLGGFETFDTTFVPAAGTNTLNIVLRRPSARILAGRAAVKTPPLTLSSRVVFMLDGRRAETVVMLRRPALRLAVSNNATRAAQKNLSIIR